MIRTVWAVARNDLAIWGRAPGIIAAALLPALGMGILVAVITATIGMQPLALVVEGNGPLAARMAHLLQADAEAYLLSPMRRVEADQALHDQKVAAIVVIPEDFDRQVVVGAARVDLVLNNVVDMDLADDIRRSVTRSVAEFDAPQLGIVGELHGPTAGIVLPNPFRVAIAERDLRRTNVTFPQYQVIPIIILVVISVGLLGTALLTARDFERSTIKLALLAPVRRGWVIAGKLLGGVLLTAALLVPLVLLGAVTRFLPSCRRDFALGSGTLKQLLSVPCGWILPVPSLTHGLAVLALVGAVTATAVGLGLLLGTAVRGTSLVVMVGLNAAVYLFFLGGGFATVPFLPAWLQTASRLVPTSYAIAGLRQALFYPDLVGFGRDLLVLCASAAGATALGTLALARGWRRA